MRVIAITPEKTSASQPTVSSTAQANPITVNGVEISAEAIALEAQQHPMPKDKPGWAWRAAAHALVLKELLVQAAQVDVVMPTPIELAEGQWETELEAAIRSLLEQVISPAEYDEEALRAVYTAQPHRFTAPSLYEAAHILLPVAKGNIEQQKLALQQAQALITDLTHHPKRFAELAQQYSACSSKNVGGVLGQLTTGDTVPEFEAALATLKVGAISAEPVVTRYGYHIIRLDARERGQVLPFETVLPYLKEAHEKADWVRKGRDYMQRLVQEADIQGIDMTDAPWVSARSAS